MAKEIAKLKEEVKAELAQLKQEFKEQLKQYREALERDMRNEIREMKIEHKNRIQSIEFGHASVEELKAKLSAEETARRKLENENIALEKRCHALECRARELEKRLVRSEQYSRNKNLEIQGVVKKDNENVLDTVQMIGKVIKEEIVETDIEICHRVPTRDPEKSNIIVQFKSRTKRDAVLNKAKKARLSNKDIGNDNTHKIYVNEHLCPTLKQLLGTAIGRKRDHGWKSVWSYNGTIFAKQSDDAPIVRIQHHEDLSKIC